MFANRISTLFRSLFSSPNRRLRSRCNCAGESLEPRQLLATFYVANTDLAAGATATGSVSRPFASIQDAVDAAAARTGSDTIKIIGGNKNFDETVTIDDSSGNLSITSAWQQTTVSGSTTAPVFDITLNAGQTVTLLNISAKNGSVGFQASGDGNLKLYTSTAANNGIGASISDVDGYAILSSFNAENNSQDGLKVSDLDGLYVSYGRFDNNGEGGIDIDGVRRTSIRSVSAKGNGDAGIRATNGEQFEVKDFSAVENQGGGVVVANMDNTYIHNGNASNNGSSGLRVSDSAVTDVSNSSFHDNTSTRYGGGIYVTGGEQFTMSSTSVNGNSATYGGGVYLKGLTGASTIANSTIKGNSIAGRWAYGGGIWNNGTLTVQATTIADNTATGEKVAGAGVYNTHSTGQLLMTDVTISGNLLDGVQNTNGRFAYALGAGIYVGMGADAVVTRARFDQNIARMNSVNTRCRARGGAGYKNSSSGTTLVVSQSWITRNEAEQGGGFYGYGSGLQIRRVSFWRNTGDDLAGLWDNI